MKITKKIFSISLLPIILLLFGGLISGFFVNSSNEATTHYINDYVQRQNKLSEITTNLGYGGAIHAFKNYVLRFEDHYRVRALESLLKIIDQIVEYKNLSPLSVEERNTMQILEATVNSYLGKLKTIQEMIENKSTQKAIDKAVKVDDTPATKALEELRVFFIKKRDIEVLKLKSSNKIAFNIIVIVFSCALLISLILGHTVSKSIIESIKKLMYISNTISSGNYDHQKNYVSDFSDDELKSLADQMIAMNKNLNETFESLKKSNEELTNFAFIASHDLQAPIKKVSSYADLLEMEVIDNRLTDEATSYIEEIKKSSLRMIKLINALLNYSLLTASKITFSKVDLVKVISDCQKNLELQIDESKANVITTNLPSVFGNEELLQSLFQNLISNSLKYRNKDLDPVIKISATKEGSNRWKITVEDNGIGFDLKYIDTIMRPFGRLHSNKDYEGLGIGLSLCKRIVETHGSSIIVSSKENEGSSFSFTLKSA